MKIAMVGAGFVADYYMATLPNHPELTLAGVFDRDQVRLERFAAFHKVAPYPSLDAVLSDPDVGLVLNLTDPHSHYAVSSVSLAAGKHVYSEKPLAMSYDEAALLVDQAKASGLTLGAAPATMLGEAAQRLWQALDEGAIGAPRLVYAEMEDGMVFRDRWQDWASASGAKWPGAHEFEIGCALEHAGYYLTWLCAFFGPAKTIQPFAIRLFDDKGTGVPASHLASDYASATIIFESGVVARITCGLGALRDRSFQVIGDTGVLYLDDGWNNSSRIQLVRTGSAGETLPQKLQRKLVERIGAWLPGRLVAGTNLPVARRGVTPAYPSQIDFMRGPALQAKAIAGGTSPQTGGDFALHVTELALAMQNATAGSAPVTLRSRFSPISRSNA